MTNDIAKIAAEKERAAVVAWLRGEAIERSRHVDCSSAEEEAAYSSSLLCLLHSATVIERADHIKGSQG